MASESPVLLSGFQVQIEDVYLLHARYLDTESPRLPQAPDQPEEIPVILSMAFDRPAWNRLSVALSVDLEMARPCRIEVSYAGVFALQRGVKQADADDVLRRAATHLAPLVLYPYVREMITSLSQRSRVGGIIVPILGFDALTEDVVDIPPPPTTGAKRRKPAPAAAVPGEKVAAPSERPTRTIKPKRKP